MDQGEPQISPIFTDGIATSRGPSENAHDARTYAIIGAAIEVHRRLGHGFLEPVYQEALAIELIDRDVPFSREVEISIQYKGRPLACGYRADFLCYESIIVELKAIRAITKVEEAQIINYLRATKLRLALLLNFGTPSLQQRRFVL